MNFRLLADNICEFDFFFIWQVVQSAAGEYEGRFHPNEFPAKPLSRNSAALQLWEIWEIHTSVISDQLETAGKHLVQCDDD